MTTNMTGRLEGQYLDKDILNKLIPDVKVKPEDLGTTDTYHEQKILDRYLSLDKDGQILIYKAALQLAIVGYGNKNYGFVRVDKDNVVTLVDIFDKYKVKYLEKINAKYGDNDLSVRRLLRLFRFQIKRFIEENNRPSYLWLKYANKNDLTVQYCSICYPGGEHLVTTKEEADFLLDTYGNLDTQLNTKFRQRLKRVFIARGIFSPEYFMNKDY